MFQNENSKNVILFKIITSLFTFKISTLCVHYYTRILLIPNLFRVIHYIYIYYIIFIIIFYIQYVNVPICKISFSCSEFESVIIFHRYSYLVKLNGMFNTIIYVISYCIFQQGSGNL